MCVVKNDNNNSLETYQCITLELKTVMRYITHYVTFISAFKNIKISTIKLTNNTISIVRNKSTNHIMKVLNVAEKNDAAKNIAGYLSRGNCKKVNIIICILK